MTVYSASYTSTEEDYLSDEDASDSLLPTGFSTYNERPTSYYSNSVHSDSLLSLSAFSDSVASTPDRSEAEGVTSEASHQGEGEGGADSGAYYAYVHGQGGLGVAPGIGPGAVMHHGFAEAYASDEYLEALQKNYFLYWTDPRHLKQPSPPPPPADDSEWRLKDRVRTVSAVLVVCLRIGYDPPDVVKPDPCAKLECWVDPYALSKDKAMERIGKNLQTQFESLVPAPKVRYKQYLDPAIEDAKKFCTSARRAAKSERLLFYYNGHGVPKPTPSGELWLFNKQYTQYIPVSLAELISWLGAPTLYIWDCSAAGNIVNKVTEVLSSVDAASADSVIQLGACEGHESLPLNPDLPADLFTCCLTSPIEIALRFFLLRNPLKTELTLDMLLKIPGKLNDRRTPLGELSWIFTAVTDSIAWNVLSKDLFQKLFRNDLVVSALFRGYLLAERIMRFYNCTPVSSPALPMTHNHPLWESWDLAVDMALAQLPSLLAYAEAAEAAERNEAASAVVAGGRGGPVTSLGPGGNPGGGVNTAASLRSSPLRPSPLRPSQALPYRQSTFFSEQLCAFEIWLDHCDAHTPQHPAQLPVVLQVLLSQAHRLKALVLLCKFLDLGPWAVSVALQIGIFAYVLRLLQAPAIELKPVLVYIWARILAVYPSCKEDLVKQTLSSNSSPPFVYFLGIFSSAQNVLPVPNVSEHRAMCAFILSVVCRGFRPGQLACLRAHLLPACLLHVHDPDPLLRQWSALCLGQLWDDCEEAKASGVSMRAHEILCAVLSSDDAPDVRAALIFALGTLQGTSGSSKPFGRSLVCLPPSSGVIATEQSDIELGIAMATLACAGDGAPAVRRELVVLLSSIVNEHPGEFVVAAYVSLKERSDYLTTYQSTASRLSDIMERLQEGTLAPAFRSVLFNCMFKTLYALMTDPASDVSALAARVVDHILNLLFRSTLGFYARQLTSYPLQIASPPRPASPAPFPESVIESVRERVVSLSVKAVKEWVNGSYHPSEAEGNSNRVKGVRTNPRSPRSSESQALRSNDTRTRLADSSKVSSTFAPGHPASSDSAAAAAGSSGATHSSASASSPSVAGNPSVTHSPGAAGNPGVAGSPSQGRVPPPPPLPEVMASLIAHDEHRLAQKRHMTAQEWALYVEQSSGAPLPLKSTFYDFALDYYREPQMPTTEPEEPGSILHNERVWRRARNESLILQTQPVKHLAGESRWDEHVSTVRVGSHVTSLLFHQFEPHLIAPNTRGEITVVDWEANRVVNAFHNGSPSHAPITSAQFVNEDDIAMLLTGAADGNVRLFRDYADPDKVHLTSAFQGISEALPTTGSRSPGLVLEWQQGRGQLLMGGNVRYIRVWDATRELSAQHFSTRSNAPLTSLTCDQVAGNIVIAGFGNGGLKMYDRRLDPRQNMVHSYDYHCSWVEDVHMQRGGSRELVSASLDGVVCTWDIRLADPLLSHELPAGLSSLGVHDHVPVFAAASQPHSVSVFSIKEDRIAPLSAFATRSTASITAIAFHPHHMMLGCANRSGDVCFYQMRSYNTLLESSSKALMHRGYIQG